MIGGSSTLCVVGQPIDMVISTSVVKEAPHLNFLQSCENAVDAFKMFMLVPNAMNHQTELQSLPAALSLVATQLTSSILYLESTFDVSSTIKKKKQSPYTIHSTLHRVS